MNTSFKVALYTAVILIVTAGSCAKGSSEPYPLQNASPASIPTPSAIPNAEISPLPEETATAAASAPSPQNSAIAPSMPVEMFDTSLTAPGVGSKPSPSPHPAIDQPSSTIPLMMPSLRPVNLREPAPMATPIYTNEQFQKGLMTVGIYKAFHGGNVLVTYPTAQHDAAIHLFAYPAMPNDVLPIPGAMQIEALIEYRIENSEPFETGQTINIVYVPGIDKPLGRYALAYYDGSHFNNTWYTAIGTSSIVSGQVMITWPLPADVHSWPRIGSCAIYRVPFLTPQHVKQRLRWDKGIDVTPLPARFRRDRGA